MQNPYLPYSVKIDEIVIETKDASLKTFKLFFLKDSDKDKFEYKPGQFAELSIFGKGEIPIGIASSPVEKDFLKFTVNRAGVVTTHLHNMSVGNIIGLRGPFGNSYPWDILNGKNILIIGGGFAFTTLRSSIIYILNSKNRQKYGNVDVIYGARSPEMLLYKDELFEWERRSDINLHITVDSTDDPRWKHNIGFVPTITKEKAPASDGNTYAIICGPPIMIKFTQPILEKLGYSPDRIIMSLENRMKCGFGMCGRCGIGKELVCKDGPVFFLNQINKTPREY